MRSRGNSVALLDSSTFNLKSAMLTSSHREFYLSLQDAANQSRKDQADWIWHVKKTLASNLDE